MKKTFIRLLNTFLDTTPRQWIHGFLKFLGLDYCSWSEFRLALVNNLKSLSAFSIYGSALGHLVVLVMVGIMSEGMLILKSKNEVVSLEDLNVKAKSKNGESIDLLEITGVYYYSKKAKKIYKKETQSRFAQLLADLKNNKPSNSSHSKIKKVKSIKELKPSDLAKMDIDWSKITQASKNSDDKNIEKDLNNHLAKYNGRFRNCYEKSLLKDPSLNAKVEFLLRVGANRNISDSEIKFVGVGTPAVKSHLQDCLRKVTRNIRLPKKSKALAGKQLKFFVVLNSWN